MPPDHKTKLLQVLIEYFFAVLPLPILAIIGLVDPNHRAVEVLTRPDVALVTTILYGLSVIRFVQSIPHISSPSNAYRQSARILVLMLWPLLGLMISAATIALYEADSEQSVGLWWNVVNFIAASATFIIFAGYGSTRTGEE